MARVGGVTVRQGSTTIMCRLACSTRIPQPITKEETGLYLLVFPASQPCNWERKKIEERPVNCSHVCKMIECGFGGADSKKVIFEPHHLQPHCKNQCSHEPQNLQVLETHLRPLLSSKKCRILQILLPQVWRFVSGVGDLDTSSFEST